MLVMPGKKVMPAKVIMNASISDDVEVEVDRRDHCQSIVAVS